MTTFFTADTHFGDQKALEYTFEGVNPRARWTTLQEQENDICDLWNKTVGPDDVVYHIGDVYNVQEPTSSNIVEQLNGHKILIRGNLDTDSKENYLRYFDEVHNKRHVVDNMLLTHYYTTHEQIKKYDCTINIHGHLHADCVQDPRYFNVSLERTDFVPISLEDLKVQVKENQLKYIKNIKF
jgi:calcineurin-like phosphoesterase family protein